MRRLIFSILAVFCGVSALLAQGGGITFEVAAPTTVEAGELFRIEFVVNAIKDVTFSQPTIEGFEILAGPEAAVGADVSIINGQTTRTESTIYTYVLQGLTAGLHTVSAARVNVAGKSYSTRPVSIEVVGTGGASSGGGADGSAGSGASGASGGSAGADSGSSASGQRGGATGAGTATGSGQGRMPEVSDEDVFILATTNRTEVYKGEPVLLTFKFYSRIPFNGLGDLKQPAFNGFWQQDISPAEPTAQRETYNNRVYDTWVLKEYLLYPQQAGTLTVEPFEATVNAIFQVRSSAPRSMFDEFFGGQDVRQVPKAIASRPLRIDVREWPQEGKPESFDGAVGEFKLETTSPPSAMAANTSGTYVLRLSGTGNFPLIRAPRLALPQSFEQYNVTTSDNTRHTRSGTSGYREFSYPFIPRSDGLYTIPALEFSYFDPGQKRYITLSSREISIEVNADTTAMAGRSGGGMVSGISREDFRVFGQDIQFIKRGSPDLHPLGRTFMWSPLYISLLTLMVVLFVGGLLVLPRYVRNMQSDRFVRGKRANKVALRRFRAAETALKRDDKHGFYDEMLKALWGYMSDKFGIPTADLTKERIREELFERNVSEAQSAEYERVISECEEAQYSPVSSSRMGELYREGVAAVSELESAIKRI